jgi:hypothetical protein
MTQPPGRCGKRKVAPDAEPAASQATCRENAFQARAASQGSGSSPTTRSTLTGQRSARRAASTPRAQSSAMTGQRAKTAA